MDGVLLAYFGIVVARRIIVVAIRLSAMAVAAIATRRFLLYAGMVRWGTPIICQFAKEIPDSAGMVYLCTGNCGRIRYCRRPLHCCCQFAKLYCFMLKCIYERQTFQRFARTCRGDESARRCHQPNQRPHRRCQTRRPAVAKPAIANCRPQSPTSHDCLAAIIGTPPRRT